MKLTIPLITLLAVVPPTISSSFAQTLLYQWEFDETGTTAPETVSGGSAANLSLVNSGNTASDLHGAAGSGVSGAAGDRAFDNSASSSMGGNGGLGRSTNFSSSTGTLSSFTLTSWINPSSAINGFGRILIIGPGGITDSGGTNTIGLLTTNQATADGTSGGGSAAGLQFNLSGVARFPTISLSLNSWTFVAVSYDDTSDTVRFYTGTTSEAVTLAYTSTNFTQEAPDLNGSGTTSSAFVGNRDNLGRAFDGLIDDTRLYDSLFGAGDASLSLDAVRVAAVPEPTTVGMTLGGLVLLVALRRIRCKTS